MKNLQCYGAPAQPPLALATNSMMTSGPNFAQLLTSTDGAGSGRPGQGGTAAAWLAALAPPQLGRLRCWRGPPLLAQPWALRVRRRRRQADVLAVAVHSHSRPACLLRESAGLTYVVGFNWTDAGGSTFAPRVWDWISANEGWIGSS